MQHDSESSSSSENESGDEDYYGGPQKEEALEEALYPGLNCSKFECLLMILNFSFRHGLTQEATKDLCKMINKIFCGKYIPHSKYMFKKIFGNCTYQYHFYCKKCDSYLGFKTNQDRRHGQIVCPDNECLEVCNVNNLNDGHFYITFPLKQQLQHLLENTDNIMDLLQYRWNRDHSEGSICDIYDGHIYKTLSEDGNFLSDPANVSITFSTDGARVFDSTKNTLWPVLFRINELPLSVRFNLPNTMVGGIWFGKSEPRMELFLKTFVNEIDDLYVNGFTWRSTCGQKVRSKCILLNCVADSKAKPLVQGTKMHSGFWGCGYCMHPGVIFEGSSQAKYPLNDDLVMMADFSFNYTVEALDPDDRPTERRLRRFVVDDRTNDKIRHDMELAEARRNVRGEGDVKGVRGKSVLFRLFFFDLVFGFAVDYLHAVLLGVTKHVTGLWLDSTSKDELYYIGLRINNVDERLLKIKPPVSISRRPRSLTERCHWKGNEWRSWLLYYSLPCLKGILPSRYLRHHCLLVSSVHLLLQEKISIQDLTDATYYLGSYCVQFCVLYGESLVFFNVHLLLHLGKCVFLWGPVFTFSAFCFETSNGRLVQLVKGSRGTLSQIAEKYTKCKMIPRLLRLYRVGEETLSFCQDLLCYRSSQIATNFNGVVVLGGALPVPLQNEEQAALQRAGHEVTSETYERMIIDGVLYHARCYRRKGKKSDSSAIKLTCGSYGVINRILHPPNRDQDDNAKPLVLVRKINVDNESVTSHTAGAKASHIKQCSLIVFGDFEVTTTENILCQVILMNCFERSFIAEFPNRYEKD